MKTKPLFHWMKEFHYHRLANPAEVSDPKNFENPKHAEVFKQIVDVEIDLQNKFWGWGIEMKRYSQGDPFIASERVNVIFLKENAYSSITPSNYSLSCEDFDLEKFSCDIQLLVDNW
jgi:hypothetical protein